MEKANDVSEEDEKSSDELEEPPTSDDQGNTPGENAAIISMFENVMKQLTLFKDHLNEKLDSHYNLLEGKIRDLSTNLNDRVVELKNELTSNHLQIRNDIRVKLSVGEKGNDVVRDNSQLVTRGEVEGENVCGSSPENIVVHPDFHSQISLQDFVTPMKTPASKVQQTPGCLNTPSTSASLSTPNNGVYVPCTVFPVSNIPILTVPPQITMSPSVQPSKTLRTIKPKPTTEDFITSGEFDVHFDDSSRPTIFPVVDPRASREFKIRGGPRTRGGIRRQEVTKTNDKPVSIPTEATRGARRGRKPQFPATRRQSERLKKNSPNKEEIPKVFKDTNLEEFIWGNESHQSPRKSDKQTDLPDMPGEKVDDQPTGIESLVTSDKNTEEVGEILDKELLRKGGDKLNKVSTHTDENSCTEVVASDIPKETPRNMPVTKKGLSLSSPRKGSHVRALDFATPAKIVPPRKANTSPKAVSQVKLAQMRSLRRGNLFKTPVKKAKPSSWDADLRAFVEPDLPVVKAGMTKRLPPKKAGRPHKFYTTKSKAQIAAAKRNKKKEIRAFRNKNQTPSKSDKEMGESHLDSSEPKSADEIVQQIQKDVLEVIQEGIVNDPIASAIINNNKEIKRPEENKNPKNAKKRVNINLTETPAKLDYNELLTTNMMTPVTKILKEQSSLLDNIQLLTPGFLPTPGSQSAANDVRTSATPGPASNPRNRTLVKTPEQESNHSAATPIKIVSVSIEEALAAENEVVKSINQSPDSKKSPGKKKTSLKLPPSVASPKKEKKNKSKEDLLRDNVLKQIGLDLFGKSPKKKTPDKKKKEVLQSNENKTKDKINKNKSKDINRKVEQKSKIVKEKVIIPKETKKKQTKEVTVKNITPMKKDLKGKSVDIKVPSFNEMMQRLNKINSFTSSSSDSSDNELVVKKSLENKISPQINKVSKSAKSSAKSFNKSREVIKDFSVCRMKHSALEKFSFDYFDEGKEDNRTVKVSPAINLFEFPIINKAEQEIKVVQNSPKKISLKKTLKQKDISSYWSLDPRVEKNQKDKKVSGGHSTELGTDPRVTKHSEFVKPVWNNKLEVMSRIVRSRSREPRQALKMSKTGLSSHRERIYERGKTPVTMKDYNHKLVMRERAHEVRRRCVSKSLNEGKENLRQDEVLEGQNVSEIKSPDMSQKQTDNSNERNNRNKSSISGSSFEPSYSSALETMSKSRDHHDYDRSSPERSSVERDVPLRKDTKGCGKKRSYSRDRSRERYDKGHRKHYSRSRSHSGDRRRRKSRSRDHKRSSERRIRRITRSREKSQSVDRSHDESHSLDRSGGRKTRSIDRILSNDQRQRNFRSKDRKGRGRSPSNKKSSSKRSRSGSRSRYRNSDRNRNLYHGRDKFRSRDDVSPWRTSKHHTKSRKDDRHTEFQHPKPIAESTPYERKKMLKESHSTTGARKHLSVDSSVTVSSGIREEFRVNREDLPRDPRIKAKDSPTSPVLVSPASPPKDPRISSKSLNYIRSIKTNELTVKHAKRKACELEEGEISDVSSVYVSSDQSRLWIDTKRRKLSDIPECDDSS